MAKLRHATRRGGDGHLWPGRPKIAASGVSKQALVRGVFRDAGRRLLKKWTDAEGGLEDLRQELAHSSSPSSASKERHDSAQEQTRPATTRPSTVAVATLNDELGEKKRNDMGFNGVAIHEDDSARTQHPQPTVSRPKIMNEQDPNAQALGADDYDEEDDESEDEVDETVAEDMRKLEENFKGISQKYRLINRIGEGNYCIRIPPQLLTSDRHLFDRVQSRATRHSPRPGHGERRPSKRPCHPSC